MAEQPDYTKKEYRLALLEKFWLKRLKKTGLSPDRIKQRLKQELKRHGAELLTNE